MSGPTDDAEKRLNAAVEVAASLLSLRATQLCLHQNGNRKARQWSDAARDLREAFAAARRSPQ